MVTFLTGAGDGAGELGLFTEGAETDEVVVRFDSATLEGCLLSSIAFAGGLDPGYTMEISGAFSANDFASVVVVVIGAAGALFELFEFVLSDFPLVEEASDNFSGSGLAVPPTGLDPLTGGGVKPVGGKFGNWVFAVAVAFTGAVEVCPPANGVLALVEELWPVVGAAGKLGNAKAACDLALLTPATSPDDLPDSSALNEPAGNRSVADSKMRRNISLW